jgi:hypothetical protein
VQSSSSNRKSLGINLAAAGNYISESVFKFIRCHSHAENLVCGVLCGEHRVVVMVMAMVMVMVMVMVM